MCIDFTNLNKACLKDSYPLPEIDQKIESLEGFKLTCFLDEYKGYHQICMAKEDEEKTSFHTEQGTFCYEKMSFGLKNDGATYQRLMDNVFASRLGRNIEIYVDGMVIKRKNEGNLISDIAKTFDTLRKANMKLNLKKFTFEVEVGQFLGYMITNEGIQANLEKVQAIINMASPRTLREVQALNGKLATLGSFLAKSVERSLAFFKTLKATKAISAVLLTDRGNMQKLIYFVNRALQGSEVNYPNHEKVALALVHAARRLRRYFQTHTICVITDQPIRQVLLKLENSGHLAKWAIELGEHEIIYKPHSAIKGQILADFLAEPPLLNNSLKEDNTNTSGKSDSPTWTLFTDGASSIEGSGAGLILTDPDGREVTYALRFNFRTSNSEAEYEALVAGLELAIQMEAQLLNVYTYSLLITNQVKGLYEAREEIMKRYLSKVQELQMHFRSFTITQISRSKNKCADALSKLASSSFSHLTKSVLVEIVPCRSIDVKAVNTIKETGPTWMDPIIHYLTNGTLPNDPIEARKVRIKAPSYSLKHDVLYRKGYLTPWLRCVRPEQANYVLREAHFGSCDAHAGARSIAQKVARPGYYWPTMYQDATKIIETCEKCQHHAPTIRQPQWIIISDNTKQFSNNPFRDWCEELKIKQNFTSVAHPQANGQTEVTNRTILQGLKARLGKAKGQWVEEFPNVLWAYRTTARAGNGCTPFSLVYGSEAVLPPEIGLPT
ncbi:reverse transcriptase domain-containing protein [Tanacetum coccineum]